MTKRRRTARIPVDMWRDRDFLSLSSARPSGRTLFLFLLTCPQSTAVPGLASLDARDAAETLGWTRGQVLAMASEIERHGLAAIAWHHGATFVFGSVANDPPANPNIAASWRRCLSGMVPSGPVFAAIAETRAACSLMGPRFLEAFEREPPEDRTPVPSWMRRQVVDRDGATCGLCGGIVEPDDIHLDHIKPWSRGGRHAVDNLRVSHSFCNLSRGNREDA